MTRLLAVLLALPLASCATFQPIRLGQGTFEIPAGCTHVALQGIDTEVGEIRCPAGFTVSYDVGELAGNSCREGQDLASPHPGVTLCRLEGDASHCANVGVANFCAHVRSGKDQDLLLHIAASFH